MKKEKIYKSDICNKDLYIIEGPIDEAYKNLKEVEADLIAKGWFDIKIDIGWGYDDERRVEFSGYRWETDAEVEAREKKSEAGKKSAAIRAAKYAERNADPEYQKYLEMRKKFGKK